MLLQYTKICLIFVDVSEKNKFTITYDVVGWNPPTNLKSLIYVYSNR